MKLSDLALSENTGVTAFLTSLVFMRLVTLQTPYYTKTHVVLGVPPWRRLKTSDIYNKLSF